MSDEQLPTNPSLMALFRTQGTRTYLIIGFAALLIYFVLMTGRGSETGAMITLLIAVPGLLARWTISPVLVILLTTYQLIDPNFMAIVSVVQGTDAYGRLGGGGYSRSLGRGWDASAYFVEDALLAAALLAYLAAQYRLFSLVTRSMPDEPRPPQRDEPDSTPVRRPAGLVSEAELRALLFTGLGCVGFGFVAWLVLRWGERGLALSSSLIIDPVLGRFLLFVWLVGVGALAARGVLGYLALRRMSPQEAQLVLQDTFWQESRREQERIHHWINWLRRRRARE
jgi:hypothetical protein